MGSGKHAGKSVPAADKKRLALLALAIIAVLAIACAPACVPGARRGASPLGPASEDATTPGAMSQDGASDGNKKDKELPDGKDSEMRGASDKEVSEEKGSNGSMRGDSSSDEGGGSNEAELPELEATGTSGDGSEAQSNVEASESKKDVNERTKGLPRKRTVGDASSGGSKNGATNTEGQAVIEDNATETPEL